MILGGSEFPETVKPQGARHIGEHGVCGVGVGRGGGERGERGERDTRLHSRSGLHPPHGVGPRKSSQIVRLVVALRRVVSRAVSLFCENACSWSSFQEKQG